MGKHISLFSFSVEFQDRSKEDMIDMVLQGIFNELMEGLCTIPSE
jgi:hypothetical protein